MSGPLDPNDAFWAAVRQRDPLVFQQVWNAALWEAWKVMDDEALTLEEKAKVMRDMTINE